MTADSPRVPVACTLEQSERADHLRDLGRLYRDGLMRREREGDRVRLWFAPESAAVVRGAMARERQCCSFLDITIEDDDGATLVTIAAPQNAQFILDAFHQLGRPIDS